MKQFMEADSRLKDEKVVIIHVTNKVVVLPYSRKHFSRWDIDKEMKENSDRGNWLSDETNTHHITLKIMPDEKWKKSTRVPEFIRKLY